MNAIQNRLVAMERNQAGWFQNRGNEKWQKRGPPNEHRPPNPLESTNIVDDSIPYCRPCEEMHDEATCPYVRRILGGLAGTSEQINLVGKELLEILSGEWINISFQLLLLPVRFFTILIKEMILLKYRKRLNTISDEFCQAPTWTLMMLQPPVIQPYLTKAPTLNLGAPTPRTPILPILRHQPQGLWPYRFTLSRNVWLYYTASKDFFTKSRPCSLCNKSLSALWLHFGFKPSKMNQVKRLSSRCVFCFILCLAFGFFCTFVFC